MSSRNASLLSIQKGLSLRLPPELGARPVGTLWEGGHVGRKSETLLRTAFEPISQVTLGDLVEDVVALRKAERRVGRFDVARLADALLEGVAALEETLQELEVPAPPEQAPVEEWRAWAREVGVTWWLDLPVSRLDWTETPIARWVQADPERTVVEALCLPPSVDTLSPSKAPQSVQARLRDLLLDRAYDTAEALAAENAWLPTLDPQSVEHEGLRDFAQRLLAARADARELSSPSSRERGERHMVLVEHPLQLQHREESWAWCGGRQAPVVTVDPRAETDVVRCPCGAGPIGRCTRAITAIDASLRVVFEERNVEQRDRLAELIDRPAWEGALGVLDSVLERLGPSAEESRERVGWRLRSQPELELQMLHLRPLDTGRISGKRVESWAADKVLESAGNPLDRRIHRLVRGGRRADVLEALRIARHHDQLFVGATGMQPLVVRQGRLSLSLRSSEGVLLETRLDGRPLSLPEWSKLTGSEAAIELLLDEDAGSALLVQTDPDTARLLRSLGPDPVQFEPAAVRELLLRVPQLRQHVELDLPEELAGRLLPSRSAPILRLELRDDDRLKVAIRVRPLAQSGVFEPGVGSDEVFAVDADGLVRCRRDLTAEIVGAEALTQILGLERGRWTRTLELVEGFAVLERVRERGLEAEWIGSRRRRVERSAGARDLAIRIRSLEQWFGIDAELTVGGKSLSLEDALAAAESGLSYVKLDEETWARLEPELVDLLRETGHRAGQGALSPLHAPAFEAMAELGAQIDAPSEWLGVLDRITEASSWTPDLPEGLDAVLREYQVDGFTWMSRLARWAGGAILADDMGLGKTVQALAMLLTRQADGPALVVAPTSVAWNWLAETERFAPSLNATQYRGVGRVLGTPGPGDVIVTSYDLLRMDIDQLADIEWTTVVFDESQALKNADSLRHKAARRLKAGVRLALSGTPVENRTAELWSVFHLLAPGYLGEREAFRARFAVPIEREDDRERRVLLARMVRPFVLRRRKSEVAKELPPRTDIVVPVELSVPEQQLYDHVRRTALSALAAGDTKGKRMNALASLTRLRQAACHPALLQPETTVDSSKLSVLQELLGDVKAEGHKALVFSQFTTHLKLVRKALEAEGYAIRYLDGSTPAGRRRSEVEAFQAGDGDVFLISLRAGGTGLNLTAATYVVHLDPWWNPAVEDQASDRAHRIGQDQPVTVYRLVSRGTVEESIVALHERKRELAEDLLAGTGSAAAMSVDELVALIAGGEMDD